jgi:two-component system sensor histidine kinase PilS (NtrC family)
MDAAAPYPQMVLAAAGRRTPESFWTSLRYFNLYRISLAALFFTSSLVYGKELILGAHSIELFRYFAAAYLLLAVVLHGVIRNVRDHFDLQLSVQVSLDILAITLMMYASAGIRSGLGVMLLVSLTGAAIIAPRRLVYLYAALSTIALLLEQGYWVLTDDQPSANFLQPGLLAIGCFATAGVTSWLAQRVAANEALARARGRALATQTRVNQLVIEDMHDGVVVLDRDARVVQHNPQAQRLLGVERLLAADLTALLTGFDAFWRGWRSGGAAASTGDFDTRGRDLRLRLLDAATEEEYSVLFIEDTTRERDQAQQLKLAALGRLTANIAHEIRNPLAAISHASELLDEDKSSTDLGRLTRIIHDNTRRLDRLVADVLQLNRRDRISAERISLAPWLAGFAAEFAANESLPAEHVALEPAAREAWIEFDREHLRQVMWNLLRNALRYARPEPRAVRLRIGAFGDRVELSVIDNGPGVPGAEQGQLFEPFFTTDSKGTGLGLYLARELCTANRAVLEYVDDLPGAHFRILFREARPA